MSERKSRQQKAGPSEVHDPALRREFQKAAIWIGMALAAYLIAILAQPILLIIGGLIIATMLDGGTRLLGRILPIPRGIRLTLVVLATILFISWTFWLMGSELSEQIAVLQVTLEQQIDSIGNWAAQIGLTASANDLKELGQQVLGSVGQVTRAVTSAVGTIASLGLMIVLGVFIAAEPRLYERGFAWMLPRDSRDAFYRTSAKIGWTLRRLMAGRLLGMFIEGIGTWLLLLLAGIPMAAILGLITGMLAFIPNIGSLVSGILIALVGFSVSVETGIYGLIIWQVVQFVDGNIIVPMVAKRAVDLAPALLLSAQILLGTLFGILGLALADPIIAMIKVYLERRSDDEAEHKPIQLEGH